MSIYIIGIVSFCYLLLLFIIAYYSENTDRLKNRLPSQSVIYALSLGVYTTAWTFYGSIGQAAENGLGFLGVYLGPTLTAPIWIYLWKKIIRICRILRITSIADFISARYGKSTTLGILVSVFCVFIVIPYISIQLKALDFSIRLLLENSTVSKQITQSTFPDVSLIFTIVFAIFAMYMGTRRMDPTEKHPGVVYVVALEAIIKLISFLLAGIVIIFFIFGGVKDIFTQAYSQINLLSYTVIDQGGIDYSSWFWIMVISAMAFLLLPRQFHIAIIENNSAAHIKTAAWLTPLYLLLISLLVIPIAFAGKLLLSNSVEADTYLLSIPLSQGYDLVAFIVFIGGLAAISGMIIVSVMALSIMMSNNIFLPLLLNVKTQFTYFLADLNTRLLQIRRLIIITILLLSYVFYKLFSINYSLVSVGLISFAGIAQLAPMVILGIYWKFSNKAGAISGFVAGIVVWAFTLPIANLSQLGIISTNLFNDGLFGLQFLKPTSLLGINHLSPIAHGSFWSLSINTFIHVTVSLLSKRSPIEISQSDIFINPEKYYKSKKPKAPVFIREADYETFSSVLQAILGKEKFNSLLNGFMADYNLDRVPQVATTELINYMEKYLSGSIGSASANIVLNHMVEQQPVDTQELIRLMDETYQVYEYSREIQTKSKELKNLTSKLTQANEKLLELDELKNEFIGNITHELRTPITSIRSLASILKDYEVSDQEKEKFLNIITEESERISVLVNQVLDIRKLEEKPILQLSDFNIVSLVHETVESFSKIRDNRTITILANNELNIHSDRSRIKQVLINLIANAIKFTDDEKGIIEVQIEEINEYVIINVSDNGIGIDKDNLDKVFTKFYQESNNSIKTKGTGLGLYLSKQLSILIGGSIELESKKNKGSRFKFRFPKFI